MRNRTGGFIDEGEFYERLAHLTKGTPKKMSKKRKIKILNDVNVVTALTNHLQSLSIIDDNDNVINYKKVPEGIEVTIEKVTNGHAEKEKD